MTWTVTKEYEQEIPEKQAGDQGFTIPDRLHVRAIIDIDNEQAELKDLIASLQKHVKEGT